MFQINSYILNNPPSKTRIFLIKGIAYLKSGLLLHLITLLFLIPGYVFALRAIQFLVNESWWASIFLGWLSSFCFTNSLLAQLDARSRWQNYKQLKDQLFEKGYRALILMPVLKSRCQRDAALVAASELGYKDLVLAYFHKKGYRWYHVFPDFMFTHPHFLFTTYFWKTTFFAKKYHSKNF